MKLLFPLVIVFVSAVTSVARAGAPSCPENRIVLTDAAGVSASVVSSDPARGAASAYARGSYDLRNGLLSSTVSFYDPGFSASRWAGSSVDTEDEYWVVGLPAGTPVDFAAEFLVGGPWSVFPGSPQGEYSCEGFVAGEGDTSRFSIRLPGGCCHGNISRSLSLTLHHLAQKPFRLQLHLASQDYRGSVDVSGRLQFSGLPPGAVVVSCQGYASDGVTPARPTTWGQLKVFYR